MPLRSPHAPSGTPPSPWSTPAPTGPPRYEFPRAEVAPGKSEPETAAADATGLEVLRELLTALLLKAATPVAPTEIHLHIDAGAFKIDATSHVDPGAVVISPGAVQVHPVLEVHPHIDATTRVDPGAIRVEAPVHVDAPQPVDVEIVRDAQSRVVGLRTVR